MVLVLNHNSLMNFESSIILNNEFILTYLKHLMSDLDIDEEEND